MKIEAKKLSADYGRRRVIEELSLAIPKGEIVSLIGANGSGKSTLLKSLARILKISGGTVYLDGRDIHSMSSHHIAKHLSLLPQVHSAPGELSVYDFVSYGRFPHSSSFGAFSKKDREAVEKAIELTQLNDLSERQLGTLSGGERQRAWIALNLAQEPQAMLLDEPTTFLDVRHQHETLELIRRMNKSLGMTIVMVLHDLNHAAHCSHKIVALKEGRIIKSGPPSEIINPELLKEVFGISARIIHDNGIPYFIPAQNII